MCVHVSSVVFINSHVTEYTLTHSHSHKENTLSLLIRTWAERLALSVPTCMIERHEVIQNYIYINRHNIRTDVHDSLWSENGMGLLLVHLCFPQTRRALFGIVYNGIVINHQTNKQINKQKSLVPAQNTRPPFYPKRFVQILHDDEVMLNVSCCCDVMHKLINNSGL